MPRAYYGKRIKELIPVIGPSISYLPLNKTLYALLDSDPPEEVTKYNWQAIYRRRRNIYFPARRVIGTKSKWISLHRVICKTEDQVDHINMNCLDARRCNLRPAKQFENSRNRGRTRNNRSGQKGVYWSKQKQKWTVEFRVNYKLLSFGAYHDKDEAIRVAREQIVRLHGEFARLDDLQNLGAITDAIMEVVNTGNPVTPPA